jgi:hypothetical protein
MRSVRDRRHAVTLFAAILGVALLATAARAQTHGFTASYTGQGAFASSVTVHFQVVPVPRNA